MQKKQEQRRSSNKNVLKAIPTNQKSEYINSNDEKKNRRRAKLISI